MKKTMKKAWMTTMRLTVCKRNLKNIMAMINKRRRRKRSQLMS